MWGVNYYGSAYYGQAINNPALKLNVWIKRVRGAIGLWTKVVKRPVQYQT